MLTNGRSRSWTAAQGMGARVSRVVVGTTPARVVVRRVPRPGARPPTRRRWREAEYRAELAQHRVAERRRSCRADVEVVDLAGPGPGSAGSRQPGCVLAIDLERAGHRNEQVAAGPTRCQRGHDRVPG